MKKIILLITLILISYTSFSQTLKPRINKNNDSLCFSLKDAKVLAKIVNNYEACKQTNIVNNNEIRNLNEQIILKDNQIDTLNLNINRYKYININNDSIISNNNKVINNLKIENKLKAKRKNRTILYLLGTNIITISIIVLIL